MLNCQMSIEEKQIMWQTQNTRHTIFFLFFLLSSLLSFSLSVAHTRALFQPYTLRFFLSICNGAFDVALARTFRLINIFDSGLLWSSLVLLLSLWWLLFCSKRTFNIIKSLGFIWKQKSNQWVLISASIDSKTIKTIFFFSASSPHSSPPLKPHIL